MQDDQETRARNVSRGLGSLALQNVLASALAYVFLFVLIRMVSYRDYTAYSSLYISVAVAVIVSAFGLQFAAARYLALFLSDAEASKAVRVTRTVLVTSFFFSLISAVAFLLLSHTLSVYYMKTPAYAFVFQLGALYLFAYSFSTILQSIIQGLRKYVLLAKMLTISRISMVLFTVVGLLVIHRVEIAVAAWIIYFGILIVWPLIVVKHDLLSRESGEAHFSFSGFKKWLGTDAENRSYYSLVLRFALPLAISGILLVISASGDSIILGHDTAELGAYGVATNIAAVLTVVLIIPLTTALLPEISSSFRSEEKVSNGVRLALRFLMLALLPMSLLIAALSRQLIDAFSGGLSSYLIAIGPLELIAGTFVMSGFALATYSLLQALARTTDAVLLSGVMAMVDIFVALILVPHFGIMGAAASKSIVALGGMALGFYLIRPYVRALDPGLFYVKSVVAAVTPAVMVYLLSAFLSNRSITVIPYSIVGLGTFILMLKSLRILSAEDRRYLSHILPSTLQKLLNFV